MTIDLESIARRERCESSTLRLAVPLLEQGYEPPFLTRYRRDELGVIPERILWEISSAIRDHQGIAARREELKKKYADGQLNDAALLASIDQAQTLRQLERIAKRIRSESGTASPAARLAVRLLNPVDGDPSDLKALAELVVGAEQATNAVEGLKSVLGQYLAADSRILNSATAWMDKHVQLHIIDVHDPHEGSASAPGDSDDEEDDDADANASAASTPTTVKHSLFNGDASADLAATISQLDAPPAAAVAEANIESAVIQPPSEAEGVEGSPTDSVESTPAAIEDGVQDAAAEDSSPEASSEPETAEDAPQSTATASEAESSPAAKTPPAAAKASKDVKKKISPRQRRRKWLVSVLEPLKGKSLPKSKLTAFQVVMLGRALRSQVVQCAFKYNAGELIQVLAKQASELNSQASNELANVVLEHESTIREAIEGAWWDDLIDRAARRLIKVAAGSLYRQMHREPIVAKSILVLDAVGPRTAALAIVGSNGEVLHTEDVPCQLTKNFRQQLVTRLGELVHQFHVNLIVLSNGPARRACMVALSELLAQSEGSSLRWTLADRAGAEIYASGPEGNRELRSIPRRFRAAVWLSQLVRNPARALAKVDVARLRLGSYQRELGEQSLADALKDVVTSGVCQFGIDANSADRGWLARLPGVSDSVAEAIDHKRRAELLKDRNELLALDVWPDLVAQRQAIGFLRVFGGANPLDATPIHPDDYALAEKLMARLDIPMPPSAPAAYQAPDYSVDNTKSSADEGPSSVATYTEVKITADPDKPFAPEIGSDETTQGAPEASSATSEPVAEDTAETNEAVVSAETSDTPPEQTSDSSGESIPAEASVAVVSEVDTPAGTEAPQVATESGTGSDDSTEMVADEVVANTSPSVAAPPAVEEYHHPLPDMSQAARIAKEWQVGEHRVRQIVRWLCEPFSDSASEATSPSATMPKVPKLNELKPGELVSGVVVGVAGFGIFVELGPDCSGLVHVSRLSEDYIEDLNEHIQIGDIITAWVVEIDNKRRRVSLSGISPERQEQLKQLRSERRGGRGNEGGKGRQPRGGASTDQPNAGRRSSTTPSGSNQSRGGSRNERPAKSGARPSGDQRSQGSGFGGGRGKTGGRRDSGNRGPSVYTTVSRSDAPQTPITDAKRSGEEPLRSFGELMQFFKGSAKPEATPEKQVREKPQAPKPSKTDESQAGASELEKPTATESVSSTTPETSGAPVVDETPKNPQ